MSLAAHETNSYEKLVPKAEGKVDDQNLVVGLRLRPMNEDEIIAGATPVAHKVDDNMVVLMDPTDDPDDILRSKRSREKQYIFDVTFDGSSSQKDVYEKTTKFLIPYVVNGYNATVFAYGATGAGKTYTMLGTAEERGIMARTLNDLFQEMENTREDMAYKVTVSFLEIYNEMIRDLLNPSSGYLELREDAKGVQVAGLSKFQAKSSREVMGILLKGNKERTQEPTAANKTSSRSHAILQITVRQKNRVRESTSGEVRLGKLFLIDLAGSERAANTQNRGKRMVEGAHINRSLLALGNCINALSDKNAHKYVNYRDSKLTRLLKDALGGNCKTVMIATISPASLHFEESRNTLVYADRAKNIKTKVRRNVMDVSYHIAQYSNIIAELREEIKRLHTKLDQKASRTSAIHTVRSALSETQSGDVQKLKDQLIEVFNNQMRLRRNLMELDNRTMEIGLEETRNTLLIQKWEREKALTTRRVQGGVGDEDINRYKEREKQQELEGLGPELPEEVVQAREDLQSLQLDEERTQRRKDSILKELQISKGRAAKIEEMLPSLSSTQDQQEVLRLLCKIHELEMENVQMQSSCIVRNMEFRQQEMAIAQYKQRHHLADELILQQRTLIDNNDVPVPKELEELYELYTHEGAGFAEVHLPNIYAHKNMTMMSLNRRLPETETNSEVDDMGSMIQLPKIFVPYNGANSIARKQLLKKSSLHLNKLEQRETLFAKSPRAMQLDSDGLHSPLKGSKSTSTLSPTPPSLHDNGARQKSILTLSSRSAATTPTPPMEPNEMKATHDSLDRTLIVNKTRNIAALAARRKNKAHVDSFNINEKQSATDSSFFITQNAEQKMTSEGYLTQSRLAQHNRRYDSPATLDNLNIDDSMSNATELNPELSRKKRSLYRNELLKKSPYVPSQQRKKAGSRDQNLANYQQLSRGPPRKQPELQTSSSSVQSEAKLRSKVPQPAKTRSHGRKPKQTDRGERNGGSTNRTAATAPNSYNSTSSNAPKAAKKPLPTIPVYRKGDISVTGQSLQR